GLLDVLQRRELRGPVPHLRPGRLSAAAARAGQPHLVGPPDLEQLSVSAEPELGRLPAIRAKARLWHSDAVPFVDDISGLRRILTRHRALAVVGLSANWYRP